MTFIKTLGPTGNLIAVDGLMPGSPQQIEDMVDAINGASGSTGVGFNVQAYGATGNGVTDDSVAVRAAISASVAAGGGTVYFPNGTYIISKDLGLEYSSAPFAACLGIPSNTTLLGQSKLGAIIKMAPSQPTSTRLLGVDSVNDVTITNLTIDGNKAGNSPGDEHMGGILAGSVADEQFRLTIRDCVFQNCRGDGITLFGYSRDVLVENVYIADCERDGMAITGYGEVRTVVRNCQFVDCTGQQFDIEPPDGGLSNVTVDSCFFRRSLSSLDYAVALSGAPGQQLDGLTFSNNVIEGPVTMIACSNVQFHHNRITTDPLDIEEPLFAQGLIVNCIIDSNIFDAAQLGVSDTPWTVGITGRVTVTPGEEAPQNVIFSNNILYAHGNAGLVLTGSYSVRVAGNKVIGEAGNSTNAINMRSNLQAQCVEIVDNHFVDFQIAVQIEPLAEEDWVQANTWIQDFVMTGNIAEQVNHATMYAWNLNHDLLGTIHRAVIYGNETKNCYGEWYPSSGLPSVPVLVGGNRTDLGAQYWHTATPEGAITANAGSLTMRASTGHGTQLYVKTTDAVNTGWVQVMSTAATGTITCTTKANYIDTDYMTIPDALLGTKVYEFDTAGDGASGGRIAVNISGATTAANVAAILKTAIEANQGTLVVTDAGSGVLTLAHKIAGVIGNVTITENVANAGHTVAGLTGGVGA